MSLLLYLIPFFVIISAVLVYPHNGKHDFLKLDLVQFFYAFIIAPLLFIWLKTFLYVLLTTELNAGLSQLQIFMVDSGFSLLCLYVFAFVVIHSLTATFNRKITRDPLYDIFAHSEFFHLWLSHLAMYGGALGIITITAFINIFFPIDMQIAKSLFYLLCFTGIITGAGCFMIVWLSDPRQEGARFMRVMKLLFGIFFILYSVVYFIFTPSFNASQGLFWWSFSTVTTLAACSLFTYKSARANTFFERISNRFKHYKWGNNIQLFKD